MLYLVCMFHFLVSVLIITLLISYISVIRPLHSSTTVYIPTPSKMYIHSLKVLQHMYYIQFPPKFCKLLIELIVYL